MKNYCLFALILLCTTLSAQRMSGIFRASDAEYEYVEDVTWDEFLSQDLQMNQKGFSLTNIETTGIGKDRRFWGIFAQSIARDTIIRTFGWPDFVKAKRAMAAAGFLMTTVQSYSATETDSYFIGVWRKEDLPHKIWKVDSKESLDQKTHEMASQQFYIKEVEVAITASGNIQYLALFHYHPIPVRNYVFVATDEKTFSTDWFQRYNSKIRLLDYEQFSTPQGSYFLGVYQPGQYESKVIRNHDRAAFNGEWEQLEKENLKLVSWEIR